MAVQFEAEAKVREDINTELIESLQTRDARNASEWDFDVVNDPEHGRWEAVLNEDAIAELPYRFVGGRVVLLSTWVSEQFRKQGVATELVGRVLDEIRTTGKKITIVCPVVGEFIAKNPQYQDLIDPKHPGEGVFKADGPGVEDSDRELTEFEQELA